MDGAGLIGIILLIFGGVVVLAGCGLTGYFVVLFDTTVPMDPQMEQFGFRSPRVNNIGLMHQQTIWTIVGIAFTVVGLALAVVGLILCVIRRQPVDAGERK